MTPTRAIGFLLLILLAGLADGCSFGLTAPKYHTAHEPEGVTIHVNTGKVAVSCELLEVRSAGIVVLANDKVQLLPHTANQSSEMDQTESRYTISNPATPPPAVQTHLRLLSRFPQGLRPELLQQLLAAHNQMELAGVTP